jgi:hypothetical protein
MSRRKWNARERLSEQQAIMLHDPKCTWPLGQPCIKFSTDGTRLGAEIAHTMGTTSEVIIAQGKAPNDDGPEPFVSDVDAEQADWEADEEPQGRGLQSCGLVHPPTPYCGPPINHEHPRPYPASKCDFPED